MESPLLRAGVAQAQLALGMSPPPSATKSEDQDVKSEKKPDIKDAEEKVKTEVKMEAALTLSMSCFSERHGRFVFC